MDWKDEKRVMVVDEGLPLGLIANTAVILGITLDKRRLETALCYLGIAICGGEEKSKRIYAAFAVNCKKCRSYRNIGLTFFCRYVTMTVSSSSLA